jgi:hypothetical protein
VIRPSFKLPLWAAVAIAAAAYVVRSIARGGDFTPELPGDAVVYVLLVLVVAAVGLGRARAAHEGDDELTGKVDQDDGTPDQEGQVQEILGEVESLDAGRTRTAPDNGEPSSKRNADGGAEPPCRGPEDAAQDGRPAR